MVCCNKNPFSHSEAVKQTLMDYLLFKYNIILSKFEKGFFTKKVK